MGTGAIDPIQLLLRWDGREVQWGWVFISDDGTSKRSFSCGSRVVNRISMLPEVVQALRGRHRNIGDIKYSRRFSSTTIIPSVMLDGGDSTINRVAKAEAWYKFHHSPLVKTDTRIHQLEAIEGEPVFVEGLDDVWEKAVLKIFPQARGCSHVSVLMENAISLSKSHLDVWVVIVDAGVRGADFVAARNGKAVWNSQTEESSAEGILYLIVNSMHRDGREPKDAMVKYFGEEIEELKVLLCKFFPETEKWDKWTGLTSIAS